MRYVSIDIETLGLDWDWCDTIEFGAVIDDMTSRIEDLPRFHCYLTQPRNQYRGEAYAMAMHSKILYRIANRESGFTYMPAENLDKVFAAWLKDQGIGDSITIAGKNFGMFDLRFLEKIGFGNETKYSHRVYDPASLFAQMDDKKLPDLKTCLFRAGIDKEIEHTAVEDAIDVIKCIRYKVCNGSLQTVIETADPENKTKKFEVYERLNDTSLGCVARCTTLEGAREYISQRKNATGPSKTSSNFTVKKPDGEVEVVN